ncbi:MFS transporter [Nostoc sphaeroides]|uniref:Membrane fusion protein DevB n=1 Tax=Nostoc sphaeroides CCNUC1 TaxID=2653204 RepID=A0A5P8WKQ5_9NOSO|nr:MFS transporter [Nostoc sphaeroides]MCC5633885.1 MFS transporter [Nostoc sphaeroides CHAB 2801]QFS52459.1 membrane fusion protein DevB [Nostoc sphaeroides CCNUC1]
MKKSTNSSLWQPLTIPNLLLLFIGENISLLGDQFYLVALPWLTIQLTNSGVSVGTVLMAAAIPRAILMLIGGVVSDRFSPRLVMLVSNALRALLTILLTIIVSLQVTQLWHLYLFAITFGVVDGFFIPAAKSILPSLVSKEQLVASNTLLQGTSQLILLIGPALGGLLIATSGIEKAFAIDAATFIFAVITLSLMKGTFKPNTVMTKNSDASSKIVSLIAGIREGLNYTWHNSSLRAVLLVLMMLNFLIIGPLQVGIPSLAHSRFSGGVVALGIMNSAWGGGGLLGTFLPQLLPRLPQLGVLMLSLASIQGFGLLLLGFIPNIVLASAVIAVLGCCGGFFTVVGITWIQKRTPPEIIGRVMSLGMLSSFGIAPFSFALAGLLADLNLAILFTVAGGIMLTTTTFLSANPSVRTID